VSPVVPAGALLWLAVGACTALLLHRGGHDRATVLLSVGCWPLFVHVAGEARPTSTYTERVDLALRRLADAARQAGEDRLDLDAVRQGLADADARVARIDALLLDHPGEPELAARRGETTRVIEAALGDLAAIRLQFALMSIDGKRERAPAELGAALASLSARLDAAAELRGSDA